MIYKAGGVNNTLDINVITDKYSTKSPNLFAIFPNESELGLFLQNVNESDMVQYDVRNIKYTAFNTEKGQVWTAEEPIYLNKALCNVNAYYPYDESMTDIEAIQIEAASQTDYMYADNTVQVNAENKSATLTMKHALSVITLNLKKGSYTGAGTITKISMRGQGIGNSSKLNGKTGELYDISGINEELSQNVSLSLAEDQTVHILFVPNPITSNVKISLWVDGNEYYVVTPGTLFEQAYRYEYTLTVDEGVLNLTAVHVGEWGFSELGNPVIWSGNHQITIDGDYQDIGLSFSESDSDITITAIHFGGNPVNDVTMLGTAILDQSDNGAVKTIKLSEISSNLTIEFKGCLSLPAAIQTSWVDLPDGIYSVRPDFLPASASEATEGCIGVAIVYNGRQMKLIIEKYEYLNPIYSSVTADFAGSESEPANQYFYWGDTTREYAITNIDDYNAVKNDFNGWNWTNYLISQSGTSYRPAWTYSYYVVREFRRQKYLGLSNWFIPSGGEFYRISQYITDINSCFALMGGTPLEGRYLTSSERSGEEYGWHININNGGLSWLKRYDYRSKLRLVHNL